MECTFKFVEPFFFADIVLVHVIEVNKIKIGSTRICIKQISLSPEMKSRPTLVFLHDALGCIASWKDFPEQLCKAIGLNGMVYDRQGHGQSEISTVERTVAYLEKEALEVLPLLLKKLGIKNPILIGSSDGGSIALIYGAKYPVKTIVSIAGHSKVEPITLKGIRGSMAILKTPPLFQKLEKLHGNKAKKLLYDWADTWLSPFFLNWNIYRYLVLIKCPALILQGEKDNYATASHAKDIALAIPGYTKDTIIKDCGHFPHLEQPEIIIAHIKNFLRLER